MTCTDDRLEELDFPAQEMQPDPPNLLEEPDFDTVPHGTVVFREDFLPCTYTPAVKGAEWLAWLCNCTPSRGEHFSQYTDWPEPVIFNRWEPTPEVKVMSKELVVIPHA